eukprot:CAMPEP_0119343538 /NCGR_PEP_ID=MMETSP1333-20130426/106500_1 /TAXON_ID=418940 /ORGANISM="Scyphosphaera apsteinii, Strain RCC1455" /LENGTH=564 /DNA_ID=CAMNT_0007355933 /DNA_START=24 /DNA_END=1718 /DNA_ORIENTATION=+
MKVSGRIHAADLVPITLPDGLSPGDSFIIRSQSSGEQFDVVVPQGLSAGDQVFVRLLRVSDGFVDMKEHKTARVAADLGGHGRAIGKLEEAEHSDTLELHTTAEADAGTGVEKEMEMEMEVEAKANTTAELQLIAAAVLEVTEIETVIAAEMIAAAVLEVAEMKRCEAEAERVRIAAEAAAAEAAGTKNLSVEASTAAASITDTKVAAGQASAKQAIEKDEDLTEVVAVVAAAERLNVADDGEPSKALRLAEAVGAAQAHAKVTCVPQVIMAMQKAQQDVAALQSTGKNEVGAMCRAQMCQVKGTQREFGGAQHLQVQREDGDAQPEKPERENGRIEQQERLAELDSAAEERLCRTLQLARLSKLWRSDVGSHKIVSKAHSPKATLCECHAEEGAYLFCKGSTSASTVRWRSSKQEMHDEQQDKVDADALLQPLLKPLAEMNLEEKVNATLLLQRASYREGIINSGVVHSCSKVLVDKRGRCGVCKTDGAEYFCVPCQVRMCDPKKSQCVTKHVGEGKGDRIQSMYDPASLADVPETPKKIEEKVKGLASLAYVAETPGQSEVC